MRPKRSGDAVVGLMADPGAAAHIAQRVAGKLPRLLERRLAS